MKEARIFIIYMRFLSFLIQDAVNTTYISALMSPLSKRKSERTRVQHLVLLRQGRVWKGEDSGHQSMTRTLLGSTTVPKLRSQGHPRATLPPGSAFHAPPPPPARGLLSYYGSRLLVTRRTSPPLSVIPRAQLPALHAASRILIGSLLTRMPLAPTASGGGSQVGT